MISLDLIGRTGNQLIQIAATIAHAERVGTSYMVPEKSLNAQEWPLLFTHFPKLTPEANKGLYVVREAQDFSWTNIPKRDNIKLHGYWQNENYFKEHRATIIREFKMPWELDKGIVGIHVRRGDYVRLARKHPPINHNYIKQALAYFYERGFRNFKVFSDDMYWCEEYFTYYHNTGIEFELMDNNDTLTDFRLMSNCEHFIISNSTYSWMAAWLSQSKDKIVVSPSKYNWFGPGNGNLKTGGIIPSSWIQIKY